MDLDIHALSIMTQTYFDAAYEMDADRFASLFHASSSVTSVTRDGGEIKVTPIESWLSVVRGATAPKALGLERRDEILSIDVFPAMALVTLRLQIPPRYFTDLLSCARVDGAWRIVQKVTTLETRAD